MRRTALAGALLLLGVAASGQEFRSIRPIRRPRPAGAVAPSPVAEQAVRQALERLVEAWNTPALRGHLGPRFYDADRLADNLAAVPRDARLRLLAVEAIRVIRQEPVPGPPGAPPRRVSLVSVAARTQVEYEDPVAGFQRLEGRNEYVFRLTEAIER